MVQYITRPGMLHKEAKIKRPMLKKRTSVYQKDFLLIKTNIGI